MKRFKQFLVPIVAIIAGIGVIITGFMTYQNSKTYLPATATIVNIEEEWTGGGDTEGSNYTYHVFINFTVDGKEYNTELGEYNASMNEGDTIDIVYNPEDPTKVQTAGATTYIILFVIGILFEIAGIFFLIKLLRGEAFDGYDDEQNVPLITIDNTRRDDI